MVLGEEKNTGEPGFSPWVPPVQLCFPVRLQDLETTMWESLGPVHPCEVQPFLPGPQLGPGSAHQDNPGAHCSAAVPEEVPHDPVPALLRASEALGRVREGEGNPQHVPSG